jgi:2-C-methyl-D-erythritol 4-phosphate cytidylyltransferase/2-C-methyl-D-erythritol 2,4-cyclodiphosphate synthase
MSAIALIVAAGRGSRLGGEMPKQYRPLGGRALLRHSVETFLAHPAVDGALVVIHPDDRVHYERAIAGHALPPPVEGGASRQVSVRRGLERLAEAAPDRVLIHDAARPFVDAGTISRTLAALDRHAGAIPAVALADSLKRSECGLVLAHLPRDGLWRAQTPQAFRFAEILAAHRACPDEALADDALVAARAGLDVAVVAGNEANFKVTEADDIVRAERHLAAVQDEVLVGNGFDVHRFAAGDHVTLCGVEVPHVAALEGHSDADVGLHALTDAILGAIGAGDIGQHFPPDDPQWRGTASHRFLTHARRLAEAAAGRVANVDVTLILERPRIAPYRQAMRERLAELLGLPTARVSVKATTTERLGFLGRGEGIAAQATATVRMRAR